MCSASYENISSANTRAGYLSADQATPVAGFKLNSRATRIFVLKGRAVRWKEERQTLQASDPRSLLIHKYPYTCEVFGVYLPGNQIMSDNVFCYGDCLFLFW